MLAQEQEFFVDFPFAATCSARSPLQLCVHLILLCMCQWIPQTTRFLKNKSRDYNSMISGALAGLTSALCSSPFDVIKTRLQVQRRGMEPHYKGGIVSISKTIFAEEGTRGFFTGLSPTLVGLVPTWMIYFTAYHHLKTFIFLEGYAPGPFAHLAAAVGAGVITDISTNPIWVVKTRMQTQILRENEPPYRSIADAMRRLVKEEGIRGLYKGLSPQLLGLVHVGIQFPSYEALKSEFRTRHVNGELTFGETMFSAFAAKMLASVIAYPHEVLRSRMQFQHSSDPARYRGLVDCMRTIWREEGYRGLYKGLSANLLRVLPATTLSFSVYEWTHKHLAEL